MTSDTIIEQLLNNIAPETLRANLSLDVVQALRVHVDRLKLSDASQALRVAESAETIANLLDNPIAQATAHVAKGAALAHLYRIPDALNHYQQSVILFEQHHCQLEATQAQVAMVWLLSASGKRDEALQLAEQGRRACEKLGATRDLARLEMAVGLIYKQSGDFERALTAYEDSRTLLVKLGETVEVARIDINRANVLQEMDRYEQAASLYEQARQALAEHEAYKELVGHIDSNLGLLAYRQGNYQQALARFEAALTAFTTNPQLTARINLRRALVYQRLNLLPEMIALSAETEPILTANQMEREQAIALHLQGIGHSQLGNVAQAQAKLTHARALFAQQNARLRLWKTDLDQMRLALSQEDWESAEKIATELLSVVAPDQWPAVIGYAYLGSAEVALRRDADTDKTADNLTHAEQIATQFALPEIALHCQQLWANQYLAQGDDERAWSALHRAIAHVEQLRANLLIDQFQMGFMDAKLDVYTDALQLALRRPNHEHELLHLLNRAHVAPLLMESASSRQTEIDDLRQAWHWHSSKLDSTLDSTEIVHLRTKISKLEEQIAELSRRSALQTTANGSKLARQQLEAAQFAQQIQGALLTTEALLHYAEIAGQAHVVLVTKTTLKHISLGSAHQITRLLQGWRHHIKDVGLLLESAEISTKLAQRFLRALHKILITPILPCINDRQHLYLVLPPRWHELPFAALYDGKHYLLQHFQLTHLPVAEAICHQHHTPVDTPASALIIGHSEEGKLPHSLREAEQINTSIGDEWHTQLYLEAEATINNVRQAISQQTLIHISTHAVFRPDNPLFSWLRLHDQRLTMAELYRTPLPNRPLVVLSACETGRGQPRAGGLSGMARALLSAGASQLVVTLWRVEEDTTATLMQNFYSHLSPNSSPVTIGTALRNAQLHLATSHHPFFWAGFISIQG